MKTMQTIATGNFEMGSESDWRNNKSIVDCLTYLPQNKSWHDVTFSFHNDGGKLLHGHRLILSLRSPVFEAMFFGLLADKQDTVDIEDIEQDIFDHILRYIYTDETNLNADNVIPILYGAKKYCLSGLVKVCSSFLESSMSCDNVCTIYEHVKLFDIIPLVQTCLAFMLENSSAVCQSEHSICLSHKSIVEFLSSEHFTGDEVDHFRLINNWAEEKCKSQNMEPTPENRREVLGEIVSKINYTLMTPGEFSEIVVPTKLLLAEDQIRLLQYLVTGNKTHLDEYPFPSGNSFIIDTRSLEGQTYEAGQFMFTFSSSSNVKLMKLFPLTLKGNREFGRKDVAMITVSKDMPHAAFKVPITKLDAAGSLTNDLDVSFKANTTYTVCITMHQICSDDEGHEIVVNNTPSVPTLKIAHTTKLRSLSIVIEQIPCCVNTVEFKVES